jgi:hypothetical protein
MAMRSGVQNKFAPKNNRSYEQEKGRKMKQQHQRLINSIARQATYETVITTK